MNRGDLVTVIIAGDYGKPRPGLIVQDDAFRGLNSVTILRLTSDPQEASLFRISVEPTPQNGLLKPSVIMVDKATTVRRDRVGKRIGRLGNETMHAVDRSLGRFLGLQ